MFKFINEIDKNLYNRTNDILNAWENRNSSVYVLIQSFFEILIKNIISNIGNKNYIESKSSLGNLLNNKYVRSVLKHDLKITPSVINQIEELNRKANSYKHLSYIEFIESNAIEHIELLYIFSSIYYEYSFNIQLEPFNKQNLLDYFMTDFEKSVVTTVSTEAEKIIEDQNKKIIELSLENEKLSEYKNRQPSTFDHEKVNNNQNTIESIKVKIAQLTTKYVEIEDHLELDYNDELIKKAEEIDDELIELYEQLDKYRYEPITEKDIEVFISNLKIEQNTKEISRLEHKKEEVTYAKEDSNIDIYRGFSNISRYLTVSYNSNYLQNKPFSIVGITENDKSSSAYKSLYATIHNQMIRGDRISPSEYLLKQKLDEKELYEVFTLEILVINLVKIDALNDNYWSLNIINNTTKYLKIAINNIFEKLRTFTKLMKSDISIPQMKITNSKEPIDHSNNISYNVVYPAISNVYTIKEEYDDSKLTHIWIQDKIKYQIDEDNQHFLLPFLNELFGFPKFKNGQIEILRNVLNGNSTIGILTTSGGKSLIYQFAALMQPKLTLIIDPINSLIQDQTRMLHSFNISSVSQLVEHKVDGQRISAKESVELFFNRPTLFSFCSPERLQNKEFRNWLILQNLDSKIGMIVLDEVHCLSEWGHDFRIPYLMLTHTINTYCKEVQYLGLTATAAINVIKDLQIELGIFDRDNIVYSKKLQRENLHFHIQKLPNFEQMHKELLQSLTEDYYHPQLTFNIDHKPSNGYIVFFKTKKQLEITQALLEKHFPNELTIFHGNQKSFQNDFIDNKKTLLLATKAFGMGIDKPNIRKSIHFGMPASRESFFQEAGRAGRDDKSATCILFTFESNLKTSPIVEKFLDLNTSINDILTLQRSIGYSDSNDLSTIAFFMTNDIDTPENEAIKACKLFDELLAVSDNEIASYTVSNKNNNTYQKSLYILHKIGLVRNWTVEYNYNSTYGFFVTYEISFHSDYNSIDHIKECSRNYVSQYSANEKTISEIERIVDYNNLVDLITVIRKWYHETFIRSKREQLANMVDFIERYKNDNKNIEIQNELSNFFDISKLLVKRESKVSLTFDKVSYVNTIKKVSKIRDEELENYRANMERLLETEDSSKISLFTSLLYLRSDMFENRNGQQRLIYALNNSEKDDIISIYKKLDPIYEVCNEMQKELLLSTLYKFNNKLYFKYIFEGNWKDDISNSYLIKSINEIYSELI